MHIGVVNCLDSYTKREHPCQTYRRFDAHVMLCKPCKSELGVCHEGSHDKIKKTFKLQVAICCLNFTDVGIL